MINRFIANVLPYMPKKFVWLFSQRYVAGESIDDAIGASRQMNEKGFCITVDLLGEFVHSLFQAEQNRNNYLDIVKRFTDEGINGNFSVKPTSFGLLIDKETCYGFIRDVVEQASLSGNFVRIDMEDSRCTTLEIDMYLRLKEEFSLNVGLAIQAYLKRTFSDVKALVEHTHVPSSPLNFRLCKGIYIESASIAYREYYEVQNNYLKILEYLLRNGVYTGIATHDSYLVSESFMLIEKHNIPASACEFQMLYGVTPALRDSIIERGYKMRVYVPFGNEWFGYCSRRINENPKMVTDILKALIVRG